MKRGYFVKEKVALLIFSSRLNCVFDTKILLVPQLRVDLNTFKNDSFLSSIILFIITHTWYKGNKNAFGNQKNCTDKK